MQKTTGYKDQINYFIAFYFGEGVIIIYWLANMKPNVLDIVK